MRKTGEKWEIWDSWDTKNSQEFTKFNILSCILLFKTPIFRSSIVNHFVLCQNILTASQNEWLSPDVAISGGGDQFFRMFPRHLTRASWFFLVVFLATSSRCSITGRRKSLNTGVNISMNRIENQAFWAKMTWYENWRKLWYYFCYFLHKTSISILSHFQT